ncbi:hypothetical protein VTO42DRAFT_1714 [Malbranchea cinnamomea]
MPSMQASVERSPIHNPLFGSKSLVCLLCWPLIPMIYLGGRCNNAATLGLYKFIQTQLQPSTILLSSNWAAT